MTDDEYKRYWEAMTGVVQDYGIMDGLWMIQEALRRAGLDGRDIVVGVIPVTLH